jgi:hypothetical protein
MELKSVVAEFTERLHALIEGHAIERARVAVLQALGVHPARKPGRPPKMSTIAGLVTKKARKKLPRQLCPVPGCKNSAAPVFGMVCAKHKDVAKSKIKKYREERRVKNLGGKVVAKAAPKRRAKTLKRPKTPKTAKKPEKAKATARKPAAAVQTPTATAAA